MKEYKEYLSNLKIFFKWIALSTITGVMVGLVGTLFYHLLAMVTNYRTSHPMIILGLPLGGLLIAYLYSLHKENIKGTNLIIEAIYSNEQIPLHMTPVIFISTIVTHLFGGSAGREGAALQIGGSIGNTIGNLFKLNKNDVTILIMCGMSAAFSAVFGTPIAATIFALEVTSVGIMYYAALVPCSIASLMGYSIAQFFNAKGESFHIVNIPNLALTPMIKVLILGTLCALVSIMFCLLLHKTHHLFEKYFSNKYYAIVFGGLTIVLLTTILRTGDYLGAGMPVIERALEGNARPEAFLVKMLLTALTLGAGYKGGEIVPSFFIGATFGCVMGNIIGLSPSLCAALGMIAVFCGVTNSPITSLIISFELFGYIGVPYFLIIVAVSYMLSGYSGLYKSQKIVYSKVETQYINKFTA